MTPPTATRVFATLAAVWTAGALGAWILALSGAPLMVTLGDHVAGMVYGAFGTVVLALLHVPSVGAPGPRWRFWAALAGQAALLFGGATTSVVTSLRAPVLVSGAIGWAAVALSLALGREGALSGIAACAAAGLTMLGLGRLDLGVALGVHAFLVPAALVLAMRVEGGTPARRAEGALVVLGLAHALLPAGRVVIDAALVGLVVLALFDRGPWGEGPRSGALRVGLFWLIVGYGGEAVAVLVGERVGSLPTHAILVGGVGSLFIDGTAEAAGGRWSLRAAAGLVLVQAAVASRVIPLALGRVSAAALVLAAVFLALGFALGLRRRA